MRQTKILFACFAALLLAVLVAFQTVDAQSVGNAGSATGAGNGAPNCQIQTGLSAGNDSSNSCENTKSANGYLVVNGSTTACVGNTFNSLAYGNGVNFVAKADPGYSNREFLAVPIPTSLPVSGVTGIRICDYNDTTGALMTTGTAINGGAAVCTRASTTHSEPAIGGAGHGYVMGQACGTDTGSTNLCLSNSGAAGSSTTCNPIFWGNCISTDCGGSNTSDITSASNISLMAAAGLTEGTITYMIPSYAGGNNVGIATISGQNGAVDIPLGSYNGQQAYTTFRDVPGTPGQWTEDTACSVGGAVNTGTNGWNIVTKTGGGLGGIGSGITGTCNGMEEWTLPVKMDWVGGLDLGCASNCADIASTTASITLPAVGSWTSKVCTFPLTGNATTDAAGIVTAIKGGTLTGTGCSTSGTFYTAAVVTLCTNNITPWTNCVVNQSLLIEPINANPETMALPSCAATGGSLCPVTDFRALNNGRTSHFSYGTMQLLLDPKGTPFYCSINDTQFGASATGNELIDNVAFNMRLWCSRGPDLSTTGAPSGSLGNWVWGDAGILNPGGPPDAFSWIVSPATLGQPTIGSGAPTAPNEQFIAGSSWTYCPNATTQCTSYIDSSGNASNVFGYVMPCNCTTWTSANGNFTPYIYQSTSANQGAFCTNSSSCTAVGSQFPVLSQYWMAITQQQNVGIVRTEMSSAGKIEIGYTEVSSSTSIPQTVQEQCVDCTNGTVGFAQTQVAMARASSTGDLVVLVGDQEGWFCAATNKPCFVMYINKWNGSSYAGTWNKTILGSCPGNNSTAAQVITATVAASWDGAHIYAMCIPAGGTSGTTSAYQYDLVTSSL